ncbi:MAG: UDP-N-acetylmuramate dehydrogenase, partial [Coriobacteriia bacterium]|nr:UDP-N-acetylmuramate dehydrogenase [Coriobacteriia bacterium]
MPVGDAYDALKSVLEGPVRANEPMARHTTYRIGGPAALYVVADSVADLTRTIRICNDHALEWSILGKGSNVLVADAGYAGVVITLGRDFRKHTLEGEELRAGAGVVLAHLVQDAFAQGLSGLEFAVGVPGTLGGALAMNAGSRDEWIGAIVDTVTLLIPDVGLVALRGSEIPWAYRRSGLSARGIIVESVLRMRQGDTLRIRHVMEASLKQRRVSQPTGMPCAGSVFVNPDGDSAGRLIEACGLKGFQVGGAIVSDVHA